MWIITLIFLISSCAVKLKKNQHAQSMISIPLREVTSDKVVSLTEPINIAFVGDVIIHERIRKREEKTQEGFHKIWENITPYLKKADMSYANLEGPVAPEIGGPTGFPMFNFPESIIPALKNNGIDIVSTANNHSLDRQGKGVRKTIENLNKYNLAYIGTVSSGKNVEEAAELWWKITPVQDLRVAWISCTEMTNGNPDKESQVLYCYKHKEVIKNLIKQLKDQVDAIILLPHWGEEETFVIESNRTIWAKKMLDDGVTAVVGSHPHVVQKIENYQTADGRNTVIAYSLGNFVSNQPWTPNKASIILYVKFGRGENQKVQVDKVAYIPLWTVRTVERDGTSKFRITPVWNIRKSEAEKIWKEQLGDERRIKSEKELDEFLK